jgi:hypothetical protein
LHEISGRSGLSPEAGALTAQRTVSIYLGSDSDPFYKISYRGDDYRDGDGDKCLAKDQAHRRPFPVRIGCVGSSFQLGRRRDFVS